LVRVGLGDTLGADDDTTAGADTAPLGAGWLGVADSASGSFSGRAATEELS
jgi:hypothetical protein